jgi:hypothetical protein
LPNKSARKRDKSALFGHQLVCIGLRCLVFFLPWPGGGRPEGGGAASGGLAVADDCVDHHQLLEGGIDAVAVDVAVEESPDLVFRQSFGGCVESLANTVGNRVTGGIAEEKGSAGEAVIPNGEGSLEMGQADDGARVESSLDGAEAQDLCFRSAGDVDHAVGSVTDEVAKGGQQLKENGGRVGFGIGSNATDHRSGKTVEGRSGKPQRHAGTGGAGGVTRIRGLGRRRRRSRSRTFCWWTCR